MSNYVLKYNDIKDELVVLNTREKEELLKCLAKSAGVEKNERNSIGFVAKVNLKKSAVEVFLKFNVDKRGVPNKRVGAAVESATDIKYLRWIPVECVVNNKQYFYRIDLMCQDLDTRTGNFHFNAMGGLQIWRNLMQNAVPLPESGGSISALTPLKSDEQGKVCVLEQADSVGKYYECHYYCENAFPQANRINRKGNNPWGYSLEIPVLDMADIDFDMQKAADFFIELIKFDLDEKVISTRNIF